MAKRKRLFDTKKLKSLEQSMSFAGKQPKAKQTETWSENRGSYKSKPGLEAEKQM